MQVRRSGLPRRAQCDQIVNRDRDRGETLAETGGNQINFECQSRVHRAMHGAGGGGGCGGEFKVRRLIIDGFINQPRLHFSQEERKE